jgi:hypothetical protein
MTSKTMLKRKETEIPVLEEGRNSGRHTLQIPLVE